MPAHLVEHRCKGASHGFRFPGDNRHPADLALVSDVIGDNLQNNLITCEARKKMVGNLIFGGDSRVGRGAESENL